MRLLGSILVILGLVCLGVLGASIVETHYYQAALERELESADSALARNVPGPLSKEKTQAVRYQEGDLVGRIEIPRLDLAVMVMEGVGDRTLRLGAGHIPGTAYPGSDGNAGIAAHRDTFFRGLDKIRENDVIVFTLPGKQVSYRVTATKIVDPSDVDVLNPTDEQTITLVTCYPFYYVGPAPKRFIVHAEAA